MAFADYCSIAGNDAVVNGFTELVRGREKRVCGQDGRADRLRIMVGGLRG